MAGEAHLVRHGVERTADLAQDHLGIRLQFGAARIEHRPVLLVDDLDAQPFGRHVHQQLILELPEHRIAFNQALDALLQLVQRRLLAALELFAQLLRFELFRFRLAHGRATLLRLNVAVLDLAGTARQILAAAVQDARCVTGTAAAGHPDLERILEELGNPLEIAVGRRAEQPHEEKEGHHRRHEVGVGNLPRAAVMAAGDLLDALDDDGAYVFAHGQSLSGNQQLIYPCAP